MCVVETTGKYSHVTFLKPINSDFELHESYKQMKTQQPKLQYLIMTHQKLYWAELVKQPVLLQVLQKCRWNECIQSSVSNTCCLHSVCNIVQYEFKLLEASLTHESEMTHVHTRSFTATDSYIIPLITPLVIPLIISWIPGQACVGID